MSRTRILLLMLVTSLLLISPVVTAQTVLTLPNSGMEGGFSAGVANGWTSYWISNGVSGAPSFFDSNTVVQANAHSQGINLLAIGIAASSSTKSYAGVYQQVSATAGRVYTLSAWHYIAATVSATNSCGVSVGIDPTGGTDPLNPKIAWSPVMWNGVSPSNVQTWKQAVVSAQAESSTITVFLNVTMIPYRFATIRPSNVYFDHLYLMEFDATPKDNAVANTGFESTFVKPDASLTDSYPQGWLPFGSAYGMNTDGIHISQQTSGSPAEGARCLEIRYGTGKTGDTGWGVCQVVRINPASTYDIYVQTKGSGYGQSRDICIDPTGALLPGPNSVCQSDGSADGIWRWTRVGPVTPVSDKISVFLRVSHTIDGNWTSWFDGIEFLQQGNETNAPAGVSNLTAANPTATTVTLSWTCTGDDGNLGRATTQIIKRSTQSITEANWDSAVTVPGVPAPEFHGTSQSMTVSGLVPNTRYYFAMKTVDECGNASPISNVATAQTLADTAPPSTITNLSVGTRLSDCIQITWTAPTHIASGTGASEPATTYDIRYSTQPITSGNWNSATPVTIQVPPVPAAPGTSQTLWVRKLSPGVTYYFAIKSSDLVGNWSSLSNCVGGTTTAQGTAPYWAWAVKERLKSWYTNTMTECLAADLDTTDSDPFAWYFDSLDKDCEAQPGIAGLLQIVRDPWLLGFLGRLSDHVWKLTYANTSIDRNIYRSSGQKVPTWNESHHLGELTWNGVGLTAVDYDNPKWLSRLVEYCRHLTYWTGYTGTPADGGPHLHFRSMWFRGDEWDRSFERGEQTLVDTPEDRRLTRAPFYATWRDPNARMPNGQLISDWLYELDSATAEDAVNTDLGKPYGVLPGEIRYDTHQIGGYSGQWWRMAASLGGTIGTSGEWWWDWRVGWVPQRDAYYELIDQYKLTGESKFIVPVRETIRHFSIDSAINDIPPQYMHEDVFGPYIAPWPDYNDPWGGYQYFVNFLYRQATGDTQFDAAWLAHASRIWQIMPRPGAPRYQRMWRSTLTWDTSVNASSWTATNPFFMAWVITKDKEWLCRALDEANSLSDPWMEAVYVGTPSLSINRLPDQPLTWNNTTSFTDFAALVLEWDDTHIKWLTYNFAASPKTIPIWLWSLKPGNYILRHGRDGNLDDHMDSVSETIPFTYSTRRTEITITLPPNQMEVWEIIPVQKTIPEAKSLPDDTPLYLHGCIVTAKFDGCFYVEKPDRSGGIKVECLSPVNLGDAVAVSGVTGTTSGERCLRAITAKVMSAGNIVPEPLLVTGKGMGGGSFGLQQGVWDANNGAAAGLNNIGLLVTVFGVVTHRDDSAFYLDDGSGLNDGSGHPGVRVATTGLAGGGSIVPPALGSYAKVTGISSCTVANGKIIRLLRPRFQADVSSTTIL